MSDLASRMAALKDKHDTQVTSKDTTPTPLRTFLYLYIQSKDECYRDYMAGAEKLIRYLSPIEFPAFDSLTPVPDILRTYEMTKLAELLSPKRNPHKAPDNAELSTIRDRENAILYSLYNEVLPRLYK